jgi:hypothetical protein
MSVLSKDKAGKVDKEKRAEKRTFPVRRLFHATAIDNLESILLHGQLCRNTLHERNIPFVELYKYPDQVGREDRDFSYCPYHLFCDTAFDFRIKQNYNNIPFLYITWNFSKPLSENWLLMPSHESKSKKMPLFEFQNLWFKVGRASYSLRTHALMFGNKVQPWEVVQTFHCINPLYRLIYLAEGVGPPCIPITRDCVIIIKSKDVFKQINAWAMKHKKTAKVLVCPHLFEPKYKYPLVSNI